MARETVLLLPGLLEDADAFGAQVDFLGERATCVVADLTRAETIAGLAEDALRQAPPAFSLAGHSMGGYVALEILRQAPARVSRLALLQTNARPDTAESTANRRRLMDLAERDFPAVIQTLMPRILAAEHVSDAEITGTISEMALGTGKEAFLRQQRAIIGRIDSRPHLGAIRCPTLVMHARDDQLMSLEMMQELAKGIPGARFEIVENSGHMATLEQPEQVARLLGSWLDN